MTQKQFSAKMVVAVQKARAYIFSKYKLSESDVEDVLQDASLKAVKNYKKFLGKCSFYTWFISICKNEIKHFYKSQSRQDIFIPQNDQERELASVEPELGRKSDLEESEFVVHSALRQLNGKHREIIELVLKNSGSSKDIADRLQIPIASARTRLFYAKRKMKKLIEAHAHKSNIQLPYGR